MSLAGEPLLTSAELRELESRHADLPLMARAGLAAARWASELALPREGPVLVVAGPGNNGGDAFVLATLLREWGHVVDLVFAGDPTAQPRDALAARTVYLETGGQILPAIPNGRPWRLIVDGLFGIGLSRAPEGRPAALIDEMNTLSSRLRTPVLALDCPSGLDADTGHVAGVVVRASQTISFIANKPGLLMADGPDHCGEIKVARLDLTVDTAPGHVIERDDFASELRPRRFNSHKGTYGSAGILGGAHSMVGAVFLSGRAALTLGAGRVYLGVMAPDAPSLDARQPELMLRKPESLLGTDLTALACGPGLGTSLQAVKLLEMALGLPLPLVLDADAINLLAYEGNLQTALATRQAPTLLTPHPAEAARLLDVDHEAVNARRLAAAKDIVERFHCHVVLKGCGTVVASPDGRWWVNRTGNPGLATAGSGDVLTGIVTSLLAQGWPIVPAALAAVHLHGLAAEERVAAGDGPCGLTAGELVAPARRILNRWIADAGKDTAY